MHVRVLTLIERALHCSTCGAPPRDVVQNVFRDPTRQGMFLPKHDGVYECIQAHLATNLRRHPVGDLVRQPRYVQLTNDLRQDDVLERYVGCG